jgi:hypothetical protein
MLSTTINNGAGCFRMRGIAYGVPVRAVADQVSNGDAQRCGQFS